MSSYNICLRNALNASFHNSIFTLTTYTKYAIRRFHTIELIFLKLSYINVPPLQNAFQLTFLVVPQPHLMQIILRFKVAYYANENPLKKSEKIAYVYQRLMYPIIIKKN